MAKMLSGSRKTDYSQYIGKKFNNWTVLKRGEDLIGPNGKSRPRLTCRCDCGEIRDVINDAVLNNGSKSCGCLQSPDLAGRKFGKLTVLERCKDKYVYPAGNKITQWFCECECGTKLLAMDCRLGERAACYNCIIKDREERFWCGFGDIPGEMVSNIRTRAMKKGEVFELDAEFMWNLFIKQGKKCALTGLDIIINRRRGGYHKKKIKTAKRIWDKENFASLDRIDNKKGYTRDNVRWVHKQINLMRHILNDEELFWFCNAILTYNKQKSIEYKIPGNLPYRLYEYQEEHDGLW